MHYGHLTIAHTSVLMWSRSFIACALRIVRWYQKVTTLLDFLSFYALHILP